MSESLWKLISRADIKKYTKNFNTKLEVESGFECESIFWNKNKYLRNNVSNHSCCEYFNLEN